MKFLVILPVAVILLAIIIAIAEAGHSKLAAPKDQNCYPHIYLSGRVEIRGFPNQVYVLEYNNLDELSKMLTIVQKDMEGKINWMGHD